jgi:hypothetical protein
MKGFLLIWHHSLLPDPQLPFLLVAQRQRARALTAADWQNVCQHESDMLFPLLDTVCTGLLFQSCFLTATKSALCPRFSPNLTARPSSDPSPFLQSIGQLSQLIALNLDGNSIQVLPYEMFMLTGLKVS